MQKLYLKLKQIKSNRSRENEESNIFIPKISKTENAKKKEKKGEQHFY